MTIKIILLTNCIIIIIIIIVIKFMYLFIYLLIYLLCLFVPSAFYYLLTSTFE